MNKELYFNFPVPLLQGVLSGKKSLKDFLSEVINFHVYSHSQKIEDLNGYEETELERFKRSASYWEVTFGNPSASLKKGKILFTKYGKDTALVGINRNMYWDFHNNAKSAFQIQCLVTFLALRSILGKKKLVKTNNDLLLARMSGVESSKNFFGEEVISISRHTLDKIKTELQTSWHLKYYSYHTRGFYISVDMSLKELITYAEGKKIKVKQHKLKVEKKQLRDSIRQELGF